MSKQNLSYWTNDPTERRPQPLRPQISSATDDNFRMPPHAHFQSDKPLTISPSVPSYSCSSSNSSRPRIVHPKKKIRLDYEQEQELLKRNTLNQQLIEQKKRDKEQQLLKFNLVHRNSAFHPYHHLPTHSNTPHPNYTNNLPYLIRLSEGEQLFPSGQTTITPFSHATPNVGKPRRSPPHLISLIRAQPPLTPPMEQPLLSPMAIPMYSPVEVESNADLPISKPLKEIYQRILDTQRTPSLDCNTVNEVIGHEEETKTKDETQSDSLFRHRSRDYPCGKAKSDTCSAPRRSRGFKPPSGKDKHVKWLNSIAGQSKSSSTQDWTQSPSSSSSSSLDLRTFKGCNTSHFKHQKESSSESFLDKAISEWTETDVYQFWNDACSRMNIPTSDCFPFVDGSKLKKMSLEEFKSVYGECGEQFYYHFKAFQAQRAVKSDEVISCCPGSPQYERKLELSPPPLHSPHVRYSHTPEDPLLQHLPHHHYFNSLHYEQQPQHHLPEGPQHIIHHPAHPGYHHTQQNPHQPQPYDSLFPQVSPHRTTPTYQSDYHAAAFHHQRLPTDEYVPQGNAYTERDWEAQNRVSKTSTSGLPVAPAASCSEPLPTLSAMSLTQEAESEGGYSESDEESYSEDRAPIPDKPIKRGPGRPRKPENEKAKKSKKSIKVWQFFRNLLHDPNYCPDYIKWEDPEKGVFRIVQSDAIAKMWGMRKSGNTKMNYEKLSRAMRYHYKNKILEAVVGKRLVYKFGENAQGWRPKDPSNPNFTRNRQ